jgi:NAD-dependent dihydropyrimidine dehydrogenase PreA subunit
MNIGEDGYPYLRYKDECWNCGACELDCQKDAILTALDWHLV